MKTLAEFWDEDAVQYFPAAATFAEWDESKHPRVPAGSDSGGEFTSVEQSGGLLNLQQLRQASRILRQHMWFVDRYELWSMKMKVNNAGRVIAVRMKSDGRWYERKEK